MSIAENAARVRESIAAAALRSGRSPASVELVAVSKTQPLEAVREAVAAGLTRLGENRPQELRDKMAAGLNAKWHLIGQLQRNKIKYVAGKVELIESVDRLELLQALQDYCAGHGLHQRILLQVNLGREPQKSGFLPEELPQALDLAAACGNLGVKGLMAVAPLVPDSQTLRPLFRSMRELFERVRTPGMDTLSMGMSSDYPVAIEEGATMVRVGRALFGQRVPLK